MTEYEGKADTRQRERNACSCQGFGTCCVMVNSPSGNRLAVGKSMFPEGQNCLKQPLALPEL